MKKIAAIAIALFFLLAASYAVLQSTFVKNYIREQLDRALADSPYNIQIEKIEGAIPNRIDLKKVTLKGEDLDLQIKSIALRPILWRLLRKELAFKDVIAKGISIDGGKPFDYKGRIRVSQERLYLKGDVDEAHIVLRYNFEKHNANFSVKYFSLRIKE